MQIIVFTLMDKYYGINTGNVEEISRKINSYKVPNAPYWVEGLINLRGNVITLVNLCKLLNLEEDLCYDYFIIVDKKQEKIALMIRDVVEVVNIQEEDIQKIREKTLDGILGIVKIKEKIVNIIDIEMLLSKNEG